MRTNTKAKTLFIIVILQFLVMIGLAIVGDYYNRQHTRMQRKVKELQSEVKTYIMTEARLQSAEKLLDGFIMCEDDCSDVEEYTLKFLGKDKI